MGHRLSSPLHGYVGQVLNALRRTGRPWRVVNLSRSGAQTRHVLDDQLPLVHGLNADLVTCGIGSNDILGTPPKRSRDHLRQVIERLLSSVVMDLTVADRFWTIGGMCSPYVAGINQTIRTATERGLPVAEVSRHAAHRGAACWPRTTSTPTTSATAATPTPYVTDDDREVLTSL
ncbi:SGNH/GDSL hydrolase family protein [Kribbella qitaiheensis]|uniref:SGNH/GDSL hydrolase family protein n=1 Tax=Kribbella qitaiheensis TaxID=1544730 RepID=UPI00360AE3B5